MELALFYSGKVFHLIEGARDDVYIEPEQITSYSSPKFLV